MGMVCQIFSVSKKQEMYLYVDKSLGLTRVPQALLAQLGELSPVMTLHLNAERKLARVNATEVLSNIQQHGFFLQMPPVTAATAEHRSGDA